LYYKSKLISTHLIFIVLSLSYNSQNSYISYFVFAPTASLFYLLHPSSRTVSTRFVEEIHPSVSKN